MRLRVLRLEERTLPAPVILGISNDTGFIGDHVTSDNTLVILGTADPGAEISVERDGQLIGLGTADGTGHWTLDATDDVLSDGRYLFTVSDGNETSAPLAVHVRANITQTIASHHDAVPNFGHEFYAAGRRIWVSEAAGSWSELFAAAGPDDVVIVQHAVTLDGAADVHTVVIESGGLLRFRPDVVTSLDVVNLQVLTGGTLEVGTAEQPITATATISFKDVPLDIDRDPQQYGNGLLVFGTVRMHGRAVSDTFVRLADEPLAGQTKLVLQSPVSGWQIGDRIALPDTHQLDWWEQHNNFASYQPQWETFVIESISGDGRTILLDRPLTYDHLGARTPSGELLYLPHVALLSRNVIVNSANPTGTRGHTLFTNRADVDLRYTQFSGLGRTTNAEVDNTTLREDGSVEHLGTNQQGRYPVHFHHLWGPQTPPESGYQFVFEGNSVVCLMNGFTFRWGVTVHDSHFGLIKGNVVYNWAGAGILTETGSETQNLFEGNFVSRISGTGERANLGRDGVAFWFHGPDNIVRGNVASNILSPGPYSYGFTITPEHVGEQLQPAFPGADPHHDGVVRDMNGTPIREFNNNEVYGATSNGLALWWLGAHGSTLPEHVRGTAGVISDFRVWHAYGWGAFIYETNGLTLESFTALGDTQHLDSSNYAAAGIFFSDYDQRDLVIRGADIRGYQVGIDAPVFLRGEARIVGGYLQAIVGVLNGTMWNVHGGDFLPARRLVIDSTRFELLEGSRNSDPYTIKMAYTVRDGSNLVQSDEVIVLNYNGTGINFRLLYEQQRGGFIMPKSGPLPDGGHPVIGSPEAGLTNAENWLKYGLAIAGSVAPPDEYLLNIDGVFGLAFPLDVLAGLPAPIITGVSEDTGLPDGITADRTLTVRGTATPGSRIGLFRGSLNVGIATADPLGEWSVDVAALDDGEYEFTAVAVDGDRTSERSDAFHIVIRSTVPPTPAISGFTDDTAEADGITADVTPQLHGTAPADALVEVLRNGVSLGTTTADASGHWTFTSTELADGSHTFTARTVDASTGLTSAESSPLVVIIDTVIPPTLTVSGPRGRITNPQPIFTWNTIADITYEVELTEQLSGTVTTIRQVSNSFRPAQPLDDGEYELRVRGISRSGVGGSFSNAIQFSLDQIPGVGTPLTWQGGGELLLRLAEDGTTLELLDDGDIIASRPLAGISQVRLTGEGSSDRLIIDATHGLPLVPGSIRWDGGGGQDSVALIESNHEITVRPSGLAAGSSSLLEWLNNESLDLSESTGTLLIQLSARDDLMTVDRVGDSLRLTTPVLPAITLGENFSALDINGLNGRDTLMLTGSMALSGTTRFAIEQVIVDIGDDWGQSISAPLMQIDGNFELRSAWSIDATIAVNGHVTTRDASVGGTGVIRLHGKANQTLTGGRTEALTTQLPAVEFAKSGGRVQLVGFLGVRHSWTTAPGAAGQIVGTGTLVFSPGGGEQWIDTGVLTIPNLLLDSGDDWGQGLNGTGRVAGRLTIRSGHFLNAILDVAGDVATFDRDLDGSGRIRLVGTRRQTLLGGGTTDDPFELPSIEYVKTAGSVVLPDLLGLRRDWITSSVVGTVTGRGTIVLTESLNGAHTIDTGRLSLPNLFIAAGDDWDRTINVVNLRIAGDLMIHSVWQLNGSPGSIRVGGNLRSTDAEILGTADITLDGTAARTTLFALDLPDGGLVLARRGSLATVTLLTDLGLPSLRVESGRLDLNGFYVTTDGLLSFARGTRLVTRRPAGQLPLLLADVFRFDSLVGLPIVDHPGVLLIDDGDGTLDLRFER